ncbi:hypothetical protein CEXT_9011 [Caerostris extrusa]|uniref:Uncharacterized protein n=1 Tax=Caerostris extrusa TaxID=172846 RepID=A0AAV4PKQ5_CAEEX|nr:hypothetical protein CEXT_9011 [Caerostris extrusa]
MTLELKETSMQRHRSSLYLENTAKLSKSLTSTKLGFIPVRLNYSVGIRLFVNSLPLFLEASIRTNFSKNQKSF